MTDAWENDVDLPCIVEIRRNADGVIRKDTSHRYHGPLIWADGNYACDCNRADFFATADDEPDPDQSCGDDAFSVRVLGLDGKVLYEDDDWEKPDAKSN